MATKPYPYQETILDDLEADRDAGSKAQLSVMATGTGKTFTSAFDAVRYLKKNNINGRVLFMVHRNRISKQARETFLQVVNDHMPHKVNAGLLSGDEEYNTDAQFLFATLQTMANRKEQFDPSAFDVLIIDEGHHSTAKTFRKTIEYFKPKLLSAWTATPDRETGDDIRDMYGNPVVDLPLPTALGRGLLTRVKYKVIADQLTRLGKMVANGEELTKAKLNKSVFIRQRDEEIMRKTFEAIEQEGVENPKLLVFCASIDHAKKLTEIFPKSAAVHSGITSEVEEKAVHDHAVGKLQTLIVIDKFNEGIDIPDANVAVFIRETASKTIFWQQLGRILRLAPDKKFALVLDFAANIQRIEDVQDLVKDAIREHKEARGQTDDDEVTDNEHLIIDDILEFEFDEVILDLIKHIENLQSLQWTEQDCIEAVRYIAAIKWIKNGIEPESLTGIEYKRIIEELGDTCPTIPSLTTIVRSFTWSDILNKAGVGIFEKSFTDQQMLDAINFALDLIECSTGTRPTKLSGMKYQMIVDLIKDTNGMRLPGNAVINKQIGWNKATGLVGLKSAKGTAVTEADLYDALRFVGDLIELREGERPTSFTSGEYGRVRQALIDAGEPNIPSHTAISKRMKWDDGLQKAGFKPSAGQNNTEKQLLDCIRYVVDFIELATGKRPATVSQNDYRFVHYALRDMGIGPKLLEANSIANRMHGWQNALKEAGLGVSRIFGASETELVDSLRYIADLVELSTGNRPTNMTQASYERAKDYLAAMSEPINLPSAQTINDKIGWSQALGLAGITPLSK